jgi:hypothetical protein
MHVKGIGVEVVEGAEQSGEAVVCLYVASRMVDSPPHEVDAGFVSPVLVDGVTHATSREGTDPHRPVH